MNSGNSCNERAHVEKAAGRRNTPTAELSQIKLSASAIVLYKDVRNDGLIRDLNMLLNLLSGEQTDIFTVIGLYSSIGHRLLSAATSLREYFIEKILFSENPFSRAAEFSGAGCLTGVMEAAVKNDLAHLQKLASLRSEWIKEMILVICGNDELMRQEVMKLPRWADMSDTGEGFSAKERSDEMESKSVQAVKSLFMDSSSWPDCAAELAEFHRKCGSGIFAQHRAFVWRRIPAYHSYEMPGMTETIPMTGENRNYEVSGTAEGSLVGVASPDPVRFADLVSYELERKDVIENTLRFLEGLPANNILLYGDRGTGKSTTVKALVNEYHDRGLRLIEIPKRLLGDFPLIIRQLVGRNLKFILFIDDLAFEDNEENYTALKAALEGGIENKPHNVIIYATSNRRHLIKERFSDRAGLYAGNADDEVRAADTLQEKLSLSDRFGMTVVFSSPDKRKYLEIVEGLAKARGINADKNYLHSEALKWEMQYNGRSPRTARQFVDWLEGHLSRQNAADIPEDGI